MGNITNQDVLHTLNQRARLIEKSLNVSLKSHGIFASQWSILYCLHRYGVMTQTEIWRYLNVEAPTVTRTLVKMEKSGWIIRKQGKDKRERIIEMTDKAKENFISVENDVNSLEEEMIGNLTTNEKEQLYNLLRKLGRVGEKKIDEQ